MPKRKHRAEKMHEAPKVTPEAPKPSHVGDAMAFFYKEALKPIQRKQVDVPLSVSSRVDAHTLEVLVALAK
jgi:hypothetical protein